MKPLKQNSFEEDWQEAFKNASISPPSDMWDKIERELERKKRRPFLFFLRPSLIASGVAAALVLVLGGVFFLNQKNVENRKIVLQNLPKNTQAGVAKANQAVSVPKTTEDIFSDDAFAMIENPAQLVDNFSLKRTAQTPHRSNKINNQESNKIFANATPAAMPKVDAEEKNSIPEIESVITQNVDNQIITNKKEGILISNSQNYFAKLNTLKSKEYTYFGSSRTLNRKKLVFDYEEPETQAMVSNESKFWLGIQSGVAPFDPNIKLGGLNTFALQAADVFAKSSNTPAIPMMGPMAGEPVGTVAVSQPQNAIRSGIGINTGFSFGYKVAKKWNIESGIRYLRGNSTLQSNTYAFQQNGYATTFLTDYLLQNSGSIATKNAINTVVADASQFSNRYEYLMIPMQLGYEISLSKKLGLNILAGISTDIFLQNMIANDNTFIQEKSIINNKNNVYKPLNISSLSGVRASYLLSKHWQVNIGGSYQYSLFSGINSATALQMRLRMLGISYGLNYRF